MDAPQHEWKMTGMFRDHDDELRVAFRCERCGVETCGYGYADDTEPWESVLLDAGNPRCEA